MKEKKRKHKNHPWNNTYKQPPKPLDKKPDDSDFEDNGYEYTDTYEPRGGQNDW